MSALEPAAEACLEKTRAAVLNVMVLAGFGIAVSGLLLRWRDRGALWRASEGVRQGLLVALFVLLVASYAVRRVGTSRSALRDPGRRCRRFFRAHVLSAVLGALAVPAGLVYGWLIRPRLEAVAPFWLAGLAFGLLALPRTAELQDFDQPIPQPSDSQA
jgi:hypothetical protein